MEIKRKGTHKIVTKNAYEKHWKKLGYEIVEDQKPKRGKKKKEDTENK